jgi:hypothetical protein
MISRLTAQHLWKNRRGNRLDLDRLAKLVLPKRKGEKNPISPEDWFGGK